MALLQGKWLGHRGVALKGGFYVRTWRGKLVICAWPRPRKGTLSAASLQRMEDFKQAQKLAQYLIAEQQILAREVSEGTPLLPRDLLTAAMYGRLWQIKLKGGRTLNSMAAANDVSQNLDIIAQVPGDMLRRGAAGWERLPGANAGWLLIAQGTDPPEFKAGTNAVRLNKTVNQNVGAGAFDAVTWNSAHFDDEGFWDAGNSNRITVPAGVSRMSFQAGLRSETSASGTVLVVVRDQDGLQIARSQGRGATDTVAENVSTGSIMVTPGDWYEVAFFTSAFRTIRGNLMTFFAAEATRYA